MAGIKNKIKDILHKDSKDRNESPTYGGTTSGADTYGSNTHGTTTGTGGGVGSKVKQAMGGYDATTSTDVPGQTEKARTGMADLDITTGTNKDSNTVGTTTGLREGHHGTSGTRTGDYETGGGMTTGGVYGSGALLLQLMCKIEYYYAVLILCDFMLGKNI